MQIISVALEVPSRRLTNDDVIDLIRRHNPDADTESVERYCRKIDRLLKRAGSHTRFIRDREAGERAFDLLLSAAKSALQRASLTAGQIDLVIYAGVGRGFLEPANAAFLSAALGACADAFDIAEACMSWTRALQVAEGLLRTGRYRHALIVDAEFNVFERGYPAALRLRSDNDLDHAFAALTVGEAATATVVSASAAEWTFRFRPLNQHAGLCSLPLPGFEDFVPEGFVGGEDGALRLSAQSAKLNAIARDGMTDFVRECYPDPKVVDRWFPHAPGEAVLSKMAADLGLTGRLQLGVFERYGNVASASVPAGLYHAVEEGKIQRGSRIVFCPVSAGMSLGLVECLF